MIVSEGTAACPSPARCVVPITSAIAGHDGAVHLQAFWAITTIFE